MKDPLPIWKITYRALGQLGPEWPIRVAAWCAQRVIQLQVGPPVIAAPGQVVFTFNQAVFQAQLMTIPPSVTDKVTAGILMSQAWQAAVLSSAWLATPGISVGAPTPATIFSAVGALTLPPSILQGKLLIQQMYAAFPATGAEQDGIVADALFSAFSSLQVSFTGSNSVTPTVGPLAAVAPAV